MQEWSVPGAAGISICLKHGEKALAHRGEVGETENGYQFKPGTEKNQPGALAEMQESDLKDCFKEIQER